MNQRDCSINEYRGQMKEPAFNRDILSSTHINFLFGAGVNGTLLPQLSKFAQTAKKIESYNISLSDGIESGIDALPDSEAREMVKNIFIKEFTDFYHVATEAGRWNTNSSLRNIEHLLRVTYSIVHESQNRNPSMKQINIYTLNYDDIVERKLSELGYFYNSISASNENVKAALINAIGYDYLTRQYIPSFMVSKLHGDIDKPIIPGKEKYRTILTPEYFEIVFHMKEQLCRANSTLIVIGYSGRDEHINKILNDCLIAGLTIYWFKYAQGDTIPFPENAKIIVREQDDFVKPIDTTAICYQDMETVWGKKLEK